ncbi:MAG: hypothetical protein ACMUJM_18660 [bacterium]
MSDGFKNKPKILHGAFVEFGLSIPPLIVPFQFNPVKLTRSRSLRFSVPNKKKTTKGEKKEERGISLREFHRREEFIDLFKLQEKQTVEVQEESIRFDIRLDATDKLNEGDPITAQFGIEPQLATLELMVHPKEESIMGAIFRMLSPKGFSWTKGENPPMILFIWGSRRVLPVNINSITITETEFSRELSPIRAEVSVDLTVIEGLDPIYTISKLDKEITSMFNIANLIDITDVVIPG